MSLHQLVERAVCMVCICVGSVSFGAAYLLIKISISLFSLSVCLFQQPVKMVAGWLAGWLAGSSLCGVFVC